jgi:hypothetical protein
MIKNQKKSNQSGSGVNSIFSSRDNIGDDSSDDDDDNRKSSSNLTKDTHAYACSKSSSSCSVGSRVVTDLDSAFKSTNSVSSLSCNSLLSTQKKRKRGDPNRLHHLSPESQLFLMRSTQLTNMFPMLTIAR